MSHKQTKGLKRNTIDKYYTKDTIVNLCISYIKQIIEIKPNDLIIEPSAGNGSFISAIKDLSNNYKFYDIQPEHLEVIKQDYLLLKVDDIKSNFDNIHIIGNPPFGRQSSLVIKFIKQSCYFAKTISFILPKSFKKETLRNKFDLNYHLIYEIDLPKKAFLVDNDEYDVPCIFQIWKRENNKREVKEKLKPLNFTFVKKTDNPDISFRRVGANAGFIDTEIENKNIQSHYFIKFINPNYNLNELKKIKFDFNNTVGPKSISKNELIIKFNFYL